MSHSLEKRGGKTSLAYNVENGTPWHLLGTPFDGKQPLQVMLKEIGADFIAYAAPAMADGYLGLTGSDRYVAICADRVVPLNEGEVEGPDGPKRKTQIFAFMGDGYEIVQYERVAERAANVVGESMDSAVFDAMGLLYQGNQFFATLDLDELIIDPQGIADKIERYLVIRSSHDGSYAITYVNSLIRAICRNTCDFAIAGATRILKARHTANVDRKLDKQEAQKALGFSTTWSDAFKQAAEKLLTVPFTPVLFDQMLEAVYQMPSGATDRQVTNVETARDTVRQLFENERNAGSFGRSGWTMYNAVVEYEDHHRPGTVENRALSTMTPGTVVDQRKTTAARLLLAQARNN